MLWCQSLQESQEIPTSQSTSKNFSCSWANGMRFDFIDLRWKNFLLNIWTDTYLCGKYSNLFPCLLNSIGPCELYIQSLISCSLYISTTISLQLTHIPFKACIRRPILRIRKCDRGLNCPIGLLASVSYRGRLLKQEIGHRVISSPGLSVWCVMHLWFISSSGRFVELYFELRRNLHVTCKPAANFLQSTRLYFNQVLFSGYEIRWLPSSRSKSPTLMLPAEIKPKYYLTMLSDIPSFRWKIPCPNFSRTVHLQPLFMESILCFKPNTTVSYRRGGITGGAIYLAPTFFPYQLFEKYFCLWFVTACSELWQQTTGRSFPPNYADDTGKLLFLNGEI